LPSRRGKSEDRLNLSDEDLMTLDSIPPQIQYGLFDFLNFKAGQLEYSEEDDEIERFFGDVYMKSGSSSTGEVCVVMESDSYRRTQLPKPRCISVLAMSMTPDIRDAPVGSYSHHLAEQAWEVCQFSPIELNSCVCDLYMAVFGACRLFPRTITTPKKKKTMCAME
jgi:hypothetical protein